MPPLQVLATGREQLLSAGACSEDDPLIERGTSIWLQRSRYAVSRRPGCPRAEYLQFPGRRPQRMHPPARCLITDLTGGVVACVRDVTTPDRVHGSEVHERTEVYTLRLGSTRWRLVASSASSTDRGGTAGVTLIAPTITGGHVIWLQTTERLEGDARHTTVDVMRAPIGGGRPQRLRRDGRLWVGTGFHPAPPNPPDDQTITFAAVYGALYYGLANVDGHPAIARVAARDLVFE